MRFWFAFILSWTATVRSLSARFWKWTIVHHPIRVISEIWFVKRTNQSAINYRTRVTWSGRCIFFSFTMSFVVRQQLVYCTSKDSIYQSKKMKSSSVRRDFQSRKQLGIISGKFIEHFFTFPIHNLLVESVSYEWETAPHRTVTVRKHSN